MPPRNAGNEIIKKLQHEYPTTWVERVVVVHLGKALYYARHLFGEKKNRTQAYTSRLPKSKLSIPASFPFKFLITASRQGK